MHAVLRDRASRATTVVTVVLLSAAVFSVAFAFAGGVQHVTLLGVTAARSTWLGALAVLTVCGTVADLATDRRAAVRRYGEAVRLLADLKAAQRLPDPTETVAEREVRLTARYQEVMAELPPVPEHQFNKLKARHLRKVEVSKLLSASPGMTVRQARANLRRRLRT